MTNIDTQRLAVDREYWDECGAPEGATHYNGNLAHPWLKGAPASYWTEYSGWVSYMSEINAIQQFACAIPRPTKTPKAEWNGRGWPSVGVRCLGRHKAFNSDFECEINGYRNGKVWFTDFSNSSEREFVCTANQIEFSLIRTPEQRLRDELAVEVYGLIGGGKARSYEIADALIAEGWTKEPKP